MSIIYPAGTGLGFLLFPPSTLPWLSLAYAFGKQTLDKQNPHAEGLLSFLF